MAAHRRDRLVWRAEAAVMSRPTSVGSMVAVSVCIASALIVAFTGGLVVGMRHACDRIDRHDLPALQRPLEGNQ